MILAVTRRQWTAFYEKLSISLIPWSETNFFFIFFWWAKVIVDFSALPGPDFVNPNSPEIKSISLAQPDPIQTLKRVGWLIAVYYGLQSIIK